MQRPKTLAITVALVAAATGTAFALNLGVIDATGPASAGGQSAAEPEVVTVVVDVPVEPDTAPTSDTGAPTTTPAVAASVPVTTPAPAPASSAPSAAPSSPATPAAGPEFRTFTTGAGQVVVADHGNHLEFWAAHPVDGWQYAVEDATDRELEIEFRRGEQEAEL